MPAVLQKSKFGLHPSALERSAPAALQRGASRPRLRAPLGLLPRAPRPAPCARRRTWPRCPRPRCPHASFPGFSPRPAQVLPGHRKHARAPGNPSPGPARETAMSLQGCGERAGKPRKAGRGARGSARRGRTTSSCLASLAGFQRPLGRARVKQELCPNVARVAPRIPAAWEWDTERLLANVMTSPGSTPRSRRRGLGSPPFQGRVGGGRRLLAPGA